MEQVMMWTLKWGLLHTYVWEIFACHRPV